MGETLTSLRCILKRAHSLLSGQDIGEYQIMSKTALEARLTLLQRIADSLGKPEADLVPWVDYDPIGVDEDSRRAVSPGVRWAGD